MKKDMLSEKSFKSPLLSKSPEMIKYILFVVLLTSCATTEQIVEDPLIASDVQMIRQLYTPSACIESKFRLKMKSPEQSRSADGVIYSDIEKKRIRIDLKDPLFGIRVAQLVTQEEKVFVKNFGKPMKELPLGDFEVSGMGESSIYLPFTLFQSLMQGSLPESVYLSRKRTRTADGQLSIETALQGASAEYFFRSNRLKSISYRRSSTGDRIEAEFAGKLGDSAYPQELELKGGKGDSLNNEMKIHFLSVKSRQNCGDSLFRPPVDS